PADSGVECGGLLSPQPQARNRRWLRTWRRDSVVSRRRRWRLGRALARATMRSVRSSIIRGRIADRNQSREDWHRLLPPYRAEEKRPCTLAAGSAWFALGRLLYSNCATRPDAPANFLTVQATDRPDRAVAAHSGSLRRGSSPALLPARLRPPSHSLL